MTDNVKLMFEVENLNNASPATVSRAGVVYISDTDLDWIPVMEAFLRLLHPLASAAVRDLFVGLVAGDDAKVLGLQALKRGERAPAASAKAKGELFRFLSGTCKSTVPTPRVVVVANIIATLRGLIASSGLTSTLLSSGKNGGGDSASAVTRTAPRKVAFAVLDGGADSTVGGPKGAAEADVDLAADDDGVDVEVLDSLQKMFVFAVLWAAGGLLGESDRKAFETWLREKLDKLDKNALLPAQVGPGSAASSLVSSGFESVDTSAAPSSLFQWMLDPNSRDWEPFVVPEASIPTGVRVCIVLAPQWPLN